jgi:phosphoserine phosphatase
MKMHIEYLRSMEESERVRAACLQYLHDSLFYFYPEHQEILAEAEELAHELGGKLQEPQHSRNYAAMEGLLGWRLAKWVQRRLRAAKGWSAQQWDWVMLRIEQCTGTRKDY